LTRDTIVWVFALFFALFNWNGGSKGQSLDVVLVYTYAISTSIWLLTDLLRFPLRGWLKSPAPQYWPESWRAALWLVFGVLLGYATGTGIGDAYAGHSTWALLHLDPKRFMAIMVSSAGISAGFLGYFYLRGKAERLQRQASEAQLKLLESQLEPHMLFNTLANLRVLIGTDPERATAMLDRLNDYLRATLQASRSDTLAMRHTLADEFARLNDYLAIMAVRMGPRMAYTLDLPKELAAHALPALLLQPLVENSIRHGLEPSVSGGEIRIEARREAQDLVLVVHDNGVGCEPAAASGFGLQQVRERLATAYGGRGRLEFLSSPGQGTTARVCLPLASPDQPQRG
jgi:hypothetical protein